MTSRVPSRGAMNGGRLNFKASEAGTSPPPSGMGPTLFNATLCPYGERAWIALLETGVAFSLVHIDLSCKPAWYRSINPRGLVPAVEYNGDVYVESLDICRWAATELQSGESINASLMPQTAADVARMEQNLQEGSRLIEAGLSLMSGRTGRYWGIGSGQSKDQKDAFHRCLENAIATPLEMHGGPYIMGDTFTVADISIFPFVRRFDVGAKAFCGFDVRGACDGAVGRWLGAIESRQSCATTAANDALLLKAYKQHMCLDFFDYDSYSVFQLHPGNEIYMQ